MKLIIPPEIQIGCRTIKIRFSNKVLDWQEHRGAESTKEEIIRLHTEQSDTAIFETLMHEIEHIINYLYAVGEEEKDTIIHATGMAQALLSLGIEPDFSQIPEEQL